MRRNLVIRYFLIFLLLFSTSLHAETDVDHAYLGVHTSRLDNGLSYQLGLPKGVHLQVDQVAPGSPAEQAGIRLYDVLLRFDDQLLINPDQLKTLVRMRNPGERISLSILRQSKPISLSVELIEARNQHAIHMIMSGTRIETPLTFINSLVPIIAFEIFPPSFL